MLLILSLSCLIFSSYSCFIFFWAFFSLSISALHPHSTKYLQDIHHLFLFNLFVMIWLFLAAQSLGGSRGGLRVCSGLVTVVSVSLLLMGECSLEPYFYECVGIAAVSEVESHDLELSLSEVAKIQVSLSQRSTHFVRNHSQLRLYACYLLGYHLVFDWDAILVELYLSVDLELLVNDCLAHCLIHQSALRLCLLCAYTYLMPLARN